MSQSLNSNPSVADPIVDPSRMRNAPRAFARLMWKELLGLRGFAILLMGVVLAFCGTLWVWQPRVSDDIAMLLLSLPQLVGIVFAIGCGALLFSQEDEAGTIDFLRGMGITSRSVVNAKLGVGIICLMVLIGGTTLCRWRPASDLELPMSDVMVAITSVGASMVVLFWTSFWSMVIRRELLTVCCGLLGTLLLKPFFDQWSEDGLLVLLTVLSSGLWLVCQLASSHWMRAGGSSFWSKTKSATLTDRLLDSQSERDSLTVQSTSRNTLPVTAGTTIVTGVVLWLVLMMLWPHYSRSGRRGEILEMIWSIVLGAILGWLPVRLERRGLQSSDVANARDWRKTIANSSATWFALWWFLSCGLLSSYRADFSEFARSELWRFCSQEVSPWTILACCSFRLMARLSSSGWLTWPLSLLALLVGWCAWWLLTMLGAPSWFGIVVISGLFASTSTLHRRLARGERPIWRANLSAGGATLTALALLWGLLNWWRVAEISPYWNRAAVPTPLPDSPMPEPDRLAALNATFAEVCAKVQPAPTVKWADGRIMACYQNDWIVMDGIRSWGDTTELTKRWVENNELAIESLLKLGEPSGLQTLCELLQASIMRPDLSQLPREAFQLCLLRARRCEELGELDEAWRLHQVAHLIYPLLQEHKGPIERYQWLGWHFDGGQRLAVWIAHPDQTSARLKEAIRDLLAERKIVPPPPDLVLAYEFAQLRQKQSEISQIDRGTMGDWSWERWLFRRLCPAESLRERRILDVVEAAHHAAFAGLHPLTQDLTATWSPSQPSKAEAPVAVSRTARWLIPSQLIGVAISIPQIYGDFAQVISRSPRLRLGVPEHSLAAGGFLSSEQIVRRLLVIAAARAYELDHGRRPTSSADLVPAYLPQRPCSISSGEDFLAPNPPAKTITPTRPPDPNEPLAVTEWRRPMFQPQANFFPTAREPVPVIIPRPTK